MKKTTKVWLALILTLVLLTYLQSEGLLGGFNSGDVGYIQVSSTIGDGCSVVYQDTLGYTTTSSSSKEACELQFATKQDKVRILVEDREIILGIKALFYWNSREGEFAFEGFNIYDEPYDSVDLYLSQPSKPFDDNGWVNWGNCITSGFSSDEDIVDWYCNRQWIPPTVLGCYGSCIEDSGARYTFKIYDSLNFITGEVEGYSPAGVSIQAVLDYIYGWLKLGGYREPASRWGGHIFLDLNQLGGVPTPTTTLPPIVTTTTLPTPNGIPTTTILIFVVWGLVVLVWLDLIKIR